MYLVCLVLHLLVPAASVLSEQDVACCNASFVVMPEMGAVEISGAMLKKQAAAASAIANVTAGANATVTVNGLRIQPTPPGMGQLCWNTRAW